jgi:hypothetical protein
MPVLRRIGLATMLLCLSTHTAHAQMLTFDEPQSSQAMTTPSTGCTRFTSAPSVDRQSANLQPSIGNLRSAIDNEGLRR